MEQFAWILMIIGVILGVVAIIATGIICWVAMGLYTSSPDKMFNRRITLMVPVIFIGVVFLIYFWINSAYLALQTGNFSKTIFLMLIGVIPFLILGIYFINNRSKVEAQKVEESKENAHIAKNVSMAKSAIQIVINEEKSGSLIKVNDGYEYKDVKIYVDVIKDTGKENTKWKKEATLLDKLQSMQLDFSNLPNNQAEGDYYLAEIIG